MREPSQPPLHCPKVDQNSKNNFYCKKKERAVLTLDFSSSTRRQSRRISEFKVYIETFRTATATQRNLISKKQTNNKILC